jgi:AcrR family transcriptional regulator
MCHNRRMATARSLRVRVRAELVEEIKAAARRHLASDGANLSLRAVARELGMVSSALYRYFPSRDDLLTALIVDAYNALGEAVERADRTVDRADLLGRYLAIAHSIRSWAQAVPNEYALIYGSPVPGYRAPEDTIAPAIRPGRALTWILFDGLASGALAAPPDTEVPAPIRADLATLRSNDFPEVPPALMARGLAAWVQIFGLVSFELFGRLDNVVVDRDAFFDHQVRELARYVGIAEPQPSSEE